MRKEDIKIKMPIEAAEILETLHEAGYEAYIVGGCVRDSILGRVPGDWDITTSALPQEVKKLFKRTIDTGIKHGTVTIMKGKEGFEVTTYRLDGVYEDHRHPKEVTFTRSLIEDLKRRDFTINAMAYNDTEGLVDEFDGLKDLDDKVIRCVGDPVRRFEEDALRILRAVRFSGQLGYTIDPETAKAVKELAPTLSNISAERIQTEFIKMITSPHPEVIRDAYELGITKVFLPEFDECMDCPQNTVHHCYTVGEHMIRSTMEIPSDKVLRITMILHDIGKPKCRTTDEHGDHFKGHALEGSLMAEKIMRRLKFDNATTNAVRNLVRCHDIFMKDEPNDVNVRRTLYYVGPENFDDLIKVKRADMLAQSTYRREDKERRLDLLTSIGHEILERGDCLSLKELKVGGKDLIDLGITPGKDIGIILNNMLKDVIGTPNHNDKEYLIKHLANYKNPVE
ncbi:CCA tRNA nucleotidyltransferase [Butyrivibrio fibrisolvens]|uniref:CCA tRNA nucleotidyltransferase n=1 Tax=Butyrivibrio fibrisolvens TaxID=831 RepID=UPI0004266813|nr:CCA tRNA nucleotidyltransferase [Butyrivibrio fibrisolvens]